MPDAGPPPDQLQAAAGLQPTLPAPGPSSAADAHKGILRRASSVSTKHRAPSAPAPTTTLHQDSPIPVQDALGLLETVDELEALSPFDLEDCLNAPNAEAALSTLTHFTADAVLAAVSAALASPSAASPPHQPPGATSPLPRAPRRSGLRPRPGIAEEQHPRPPPRRDTPPPQAAHTQETGHGCTRHGPLARLWAA